jgi:hypothetical protein
MVSSLGASVATGRIRAVSVSGNPTTEVLERVAENHLTGRAPVQVQRRYRLSDGVKALSDFAGGTVGKLVIAVSAPQ